MILNELQNYLLDRHCVSLADMERHFQMEGEALRAMLNKLIKKGRVKKLAIATKCQNCSSCHRDTLEFYEWVDRSNLSINRSPPQKIELYIQDLHCQMCAQTVREALQKINGVKRVKVNLSQKKVAVEIVCNQEYTTAFLIKTLETRGYRAKSITTVKLS